MTDNTFTQALKNVELDVSANGKIANDNEQNKTVKQLMIEAGIDDLNATSTPEQLIASIKKFVALSANKDVVSKGVGQSELIKRLKEIKIQGATKLVYAAFRKTDTNPDTGSGEGLLFDDPEPWSDLVDGDKLLTEILTIIQRYVILPEGRAAALTLWIGFAWLHDAFSISPLIDFNSPTKRCGKSTGLKVVSLLAPRPLRTANISTAALFRTIEHHQPTLLIDEADTFLGYNDDLNGILNAGHERDGAFVFRCEGDDSKPKSFCVWGPKVIAGIGKRKDTLEDRSISIPMKRKGVEEKVEKLRHGNHEQFSILKRKAARWAKDNLEFARAWGPLIPESLNDRAADNWGPLLTVAEIAGGQWPELGKEAALLISGSQDDDDEDSIGVMLLMDIFAYFRENEVDRVTSEDIEGHLVGLEDRPWPEYRKGEHITKAGIARLLKPFKINPRQIRVGARNLKGYEADSFEDAFSRYLPNRGIQTETPDTRLNNKDLNDYQIETQEGDVSVRKPFKPLQKKECFGVSVGTGVKGGKQKKGGEEGQQGEQGEAPDLLDSKNDGNPLWEGTL